MDYQTVSLRDRLHRYVDARTWALRENINDIKDTIYSGYWEEVLHLVGADAPSVVSQRMEVRRAYARRQLLHPGEDPKPNLSPIRPGRLATD